MSLCLVDIHGDIEGDYDIIHNFPRNATNGDMIMAMFGFEPRKNTCILPKDYCNGNPAECDGCKYNSWWNAPYKGGKEE